MSVQSPVKVVTRAQMGTKGPPYDAAPTRVNQGLHMSRPRISILSESSRPFSLLVQIAGLTALANSYEQQARYGSYDAVCRGNPSSLLG